MVSASNACTSWPSSVWWIWRAVPPSRSLFSTRCTGKPCSARANAAVMPAMPPPTTSAALLTGTILPASGTSAAARAAAIRTRSIAFSVAASGSPEWTQEHWSRMLAISSR